MDDDFGAIATSYIRLDPNWGSDLDLLKTSINALRGRCPRVRYTDIGCGPGFHLAMVKHLYPEICVTGIDTCALMLEEARKLVQRLEVDDVSLIQADVRQFWAPLPSHVLSFLNNSLGNVCPEKKDEWPAARFKVVEKLRSMIEDNGHLVVSVYTPEPTPVEYGPRLRLVHISGNDYSIVYSPPGGSTITYHSHRFGEGELVELLERNKFKIELLEKRMARLVVRARAV